MTPAYARNAEGAVGGSVPAMLSLTLGAPASFGAFHAKAWRRTTPRPRWPTSSPARAMPRSTNELPGSPHQRLVRAARAARQVRAQQDRLWTAPLWPTTWSPSRSSSTNGSRRRAPHRPVREDAHADALDDHKKAVNGRRFAGGCCPFGQSRNRRTRLRGRSWLPAREAGRVVVPLTFAPPPRTGDAAQGDWSPARLRSPPLTRAGANRRAGPVPTLPKPAAAARTAAACGFFALSAMAIAGRPHHVALFTAARLLVSGDERLPWSAALSVRLSALALAFGVTTAAALVVADPLSIWAALSPVDVDPHRCGRDGLAALGHPASGARRRVGPRDRAGRWPATTRSPGGQRVDGVAGGLQLSARRASPHWGAVDRHRCGRFADHSLIGPERRAGPARPVPCAGMPGSRL